MREPEPEQHMAAAKILRGDGATVPVNKLKADDDVLKRIVNTGDSTQFVTFMDVPGFVRAILGANLPAGHS